MQAIIDRHNYSQMQNGAIVEEKNFKCSLLIFKLKYVDNNKDPTDMLEIRICENPADNFELKKEGEGPPEEVPIVEDQ